jgi:hypothetical protein
MKPVETSKQIPIWGTSTYTHNTHTHTTHKQTHIHTQHTNKHTHTHARAFARQRVNVCKAYQWYVALPLLSKNQV